MRVADSLDSAEGVPTESFIGSKIGQHSQIITGTVHGDPNRLKVFVFNVQQLIQPTDNVSRKVRDEDENLGDALYSHLENAGDLFVIADEHHVYHEKAKAFSAAIRDLGPVASWG